MSANPWDTDRPAVPWINGGAWGGWPVHRMRELAVSIKANADRLTNATVDLPAAGVYPSKAGFRKFYGDVLAALRELCDRTTPNMISPLYFDYVTAPSGNTKITETYLGINGAEASDWQFVSDIRPWVKMRTALDRLCYVKATGQSSVVYASPVKMLEDGDIEYGSRPAEVSIGGTGSKVYFKIPQETDALFAYVDELINGKQVVLNMNIDVGYGADESGTYTTLSGTRSLTQTITLGDEFSDGQLYRWVQESYDGSVRVNRYLSIDPQAPFDERTRMSAVWRRVPHPLEDFDVGPGSLATSLGTIGDDAETGQFGDDPLVMISGMPIAEVDTNMPWLDAAGPYVHNLEVWNAFYIYRLNVWQTLPSLYVTP